MSRRRYGYVSCPSTRFSAIVRWGAKKLGKVKRVGWDTSPEELEGLTAGDVYALVARDPFRMGHDGVVTAVKAIRQHEQLTNEDTGARVWIRRAEREAGCRGRCV
jgi:ABC-type sugar transport system substrate-binding protein